MANQETQILDEVITSTRRNMLNLGLKSLAGIAAEVFASRAEAARFTDADILNFALNLEYLEANFYYLAAFGTTIDVPNAASTAAGAPKITLSGTVGTPGIVSGGTRFRSARSKSVRTRLRPQWKRVNTCSCCWAHLAHQPLPNLRSISGSFPALATAAKIPNGSSFSPYASDEDFLVGAYVFEDVGVTAYHGAAPLLTTPSNLTVAAGILAVEAYHACLIRTTINYIDPTGTSIAGYTNLISTLRASLSQAGLLRVAPGPYDTNPDDFGLALFQVSLGGSGNVTATRLTDADQTNVIAFARNTTQVLNIVTGGGAVSSGKVVSPAMGIFFPTA